MVDLAAGNYLVQVYSNGAVAPSATVGLTGSVAAGDVRVVANPDAGAVVLGRAQQTSGSINFNGDDAVVLRKGGAAGPVLDSIGQVGVRPIPEWGTAAVGTLDSTLRRKAAVTEGDSVVSDAFDPAVEWDGFPIDSFDALGAHPGLPVDLAPIVSSLTAGSSGTGAVNVRPVRDVHGGSDARCGRVHAHLHDVGARSR